MELLKLFSSFCILQSLSKLGSYGCTAKKTRASTIPDLLLVGYCVYVLQQAGYQRSSVLVAAGTLPHKRAYIYSLYSWLLLLQDSHSLLRPAAITTAV
jgi:hypothetical protein